MRASTVITVADNSQVAEARRMALGCAAGVRFSETAAARAAIAVTELATNLVKHGSGGEIIISTENFDGRSIDLVSVDKGKGIGSVPAAMQDGYSTAGSPGTGLGAISRAATFFDAWSEPGLGTVLLCRIVDEEPRRAASPTAAIRVAGICMAKPGEPQPGDAWDSVSDRNSVSIAIADGLGHGPGAADASTRAIGVFLERKDYSAEEILRAMHDPLRSTRGAAVAVARIHIERGVVEFIGVGNIAGAVVAEGGAVRRSVSLPGIVGHEMRRVQPFTYAWPAGALLVMHSDGLSSSWSLDSYPGLAQRDAAIIAAVLYRDFWRSSDDVTVVVAKS